MLIEPQAGFQSSFESRFRKPRGRVLLYSHSFLSARTTDAHNVVDSSNVYAQKFIPTDNMSARFIDLFISRNEGVESLLDIRILGDNAGLPDSGNVLHHGAIYNLNNKMPRWHRVEISPSSNLSQGVPYWVEITAGGTTSIRWHKNSNTLGVNISKNGAIEYTDQSFIFKIRDENTALNAFVVDELINYTTNQESNTRGKSGTFSISNVDGVYSNGQPLRGLFSPGTEVKFQIGTASGIFISTSSQIIESADNQTNTLNVQTFGKFNLFINQEVLFKSSYIGQDFTNVVLDLIGQAGAFSGVALFADDGNFADSGISADGANANADLTGLTFPSFGTLEGKLSDAIQKIEEATNFRFYFDNEGVPTFKPRLTPSEPVFCFDDSIHIIRDSISSNKEIKNLFNRVSGNNSQTSDYENIKLDPAILISSETGVVQANQRAITITVVYPFPCLRSTIQNIATNDSSVFELSRSVDSITVEVQNKKYPVSPINFSFNVFAQKISNDSVSLVVNEKLDYFSVLDNGIVDFEITNNLIESMSLLNKYIDRLILFNSRDREFVTLTTIGQPLLELEDTVCIKTSRAGLRDDFIFKVTNITTMYANSPRSYITTFVLQKYPFLIGEKINNIYLYSDDGHFSDNGLFADSDSGATKLTYV